MTNIFKNLKLKRRLITLLAGMHFYGHPSGKMKVVGVTGTNGKTTTTTLLYEVAIALGYRAGLIGTVENIINGERRPATHTTPDPISLHKILNEMAESGCEYVFMEVSSHALDQNRVAGIRFAGGVFTNLTHDHLDYHRSIGNYFGAKKKLFQMLPKGAFALSNADDEYGIDMVEGIKAQNIFYGFKGKEDFHGEILKMDFAGLTLSINNNKVKSKLLGKFNAYNLLAVWSVCRLLGFDKDKVNKVIVKIEPPRGRFQHFMSPTGVLVVVDYAHTPDALEKILLAIKEVKPSGGRFISVFGCGGDRDPLKRPIMGKIGAMLSDIAIFTSDNPRNEDPEKIIEQMKTDLSPEELRKVTIISNRKEAILRSVLLAQKGDVILCAGKGHEDYQEINAIKHHFDDMEEYIQAYSSQTEDVLR